MCSHHGMPLSLGRYVPRYGLIESPINGWRYNIDGKCVSIPSITSTHVPENSHVPAYQVAERDGYIYVWIGDGKAEGEPTPIDHIMDYEVWNQQTMIYDCDPQLCLNLDVDLTIQHFLHGQKSWRSFRRFPWIRSPKPLPYLQNVDLIPKENGFEMKVKISESKSGDEPRDTLITEFSLPDRITRKRLHSKKRYSKFCDYISVSHYIPIIEADGKIKTRAEFLFTSKVLPGYAFRRFRFESWKTKYAIPAERRREKMYLEAQQKNIDFGNIPEELDLPIYKPHKLMKEIMKRKSEGNWTPETYQSIEKDSFQFTDGYQ